jgi:predicted TIM-barrel fold metal-dependent hydrolase
MVGTNLPVDWLFSNSTQVFHALAAATSSLEPTQKKAILSGNAERIYRT